MLERKEYIGGQKPLESGFTCHGVREGCETAKRKGEETNDIYDSKCGCGGLACRSECLRARGEIPTCM